LADTPQGVPFVLIGAADRLITVRYTSFAVERSETPAEGFIVSSLQEESLQTAGCDPRAGGDCVFRATH
jgi:hypothetical protein